jgi:hypothetical protein
MQPLRIRINRIVDFGTVVSLAGLDTKTAMLITVHIDHRPFAAFRKAWDEAGLPSPIEYAASRLMLHLHMRPTEPARNTKAETAVVTTTDRNRDPAQELGQ